MLEGFFAHRHMAHLAARSGFALAVEMEMGHVTVCEDSLERALEIVLSIKKRLA